MITGLDHLVLTVRSVEATLAFYRDALGLEGVAFKGRFALQLGDQKINLHQAGAEFSPHARAPTPGSGDLCLLSDEPVEAVAARLEAQGIVIEEGPVPRTGARFPLRSIYFRDPDGNLVEVANEARGVPAG